MGLFRPKIKKLKSQGRVDSLIKALGHKDRQTRWEAAKALGEIGDSRALEPLTTALSDGHALVREYASEALANVLGIESSIVRSERIVTALARAIRDESCHGYGYFTRQNLIKALAKIGNMDAEQVLVNALEEDTLNRLDLEVVKSLENIGWKPDKSKASLVYWATKGQVDKCTEIGEQALDKLISLLTRKSITVRKTAADALARISDPRAVEPLMNALRDKAPIVREAVVEALGRIANSRAVQPLLWTIKVNKNYSLNEKVVDALENIGEPAVDALFQVVSNKSNLFIARYKAVRALGKLGDQRAKEFLTKILKEEDQIDLLEAATESLDVLVWQPDQKVSGAMYWALKGKWDKCVEIGDPAVKPLLLILTNGKSHEAYTTFKEIGSSKAREALETYWKFLNKQLEETQSKVYEESKRWGGSTFPDYFARDAFQRRIDDSLKPQISRVRKELDQFNLRS